MKRVLLTGAGGSIGVHFIAHILHNTDWEIVVTDSFRHKGEFDRITRVCRNHPEWPGRIQTIIHDLVAPFTPREIDEIGHVDYVINLASLSDVQGSIDDPVPFALNNTALVLNMLEYARVAKPEAFIQFSTDEVYGAAAIDQAHPEWATIMPSNVYAASKAAQEAYAIAYWRSYGVPVIITNTMNNFGEMQQPNKYPVKIQKAVENDEVVQVHSTATGEVGTRFYLHSRNAADAILFILQNKKPTLHEAGHVDRPDRYNVVGDRQVSNLELAQVIAKLMGKELNYKLVNFHDSNPGHDSHYGLDGAKLRELGWQPPLDFEKSLKNTIEWQQRNSGWIR